MVNIQTHQTLLPKQLYIGDNAVLQSNFSLDADSINQAFENLQNGKFEKVIELSPSYFADPVDFSKVEIKSIKLNQISSSEYSFEINFVPWTTDPVLFSDYNLTAALNQTSSSDVDFALSFDAVSVISIVHQQGITAIKDEVSPLLLPGTTYKLFAIIFVIILLFAGLIRLVIKHKAVIEFIKSVKLKIKYKRNLKQTELQLLRIKNDDEITPHDAGEEIQRIMRHYLEVRFDYPFTRTVSSDFIRAFTNSSQTDLVDFKMNACNEIIEVFKRTDYFRYSPNANFAESGSGKGQDNEDNGDRDNKIYNEKHKIIQTLIDSIYDIEKPVEKKEEIKEINTEDVQEEADV